jgi:aspartyl aminopeptidase
VDRNINESFKFNQETEFVPILGQIASQLNEAKGEKEPGPKKASSVQGNHHPALLALLAGELSVAPEEIHDFELYVSFRRTARSQPILSS